MPSPFSALRITGGKHSGIASGKRHFGGEESLTLYIIAFAVATLMLSLGGYLGINIW